MGELTQGVSWLAVIVGAVAAFLIGWAWYSPFLFLKGWAKDLGIDTDGGEGMHPVAMVTQFVGLLLMSWFVGVTAASNALFTVILATIAFTVLSYSGGLFAKKGAYARNVDAGYWIVALIVMIICQGLLR